MSGLRHLPLRRGLFSIESVQGPYEGWTTGEEWNGWACPYFERAVALEVVEGYKAAHADSAEDPRSLADYVSETDAFRFYDPASDEWESYAGEEVGGLTLYPIGSRCWTWSRVDL